MLKYTKKCPYGKCTECDYELNSELLNEYTPNYCINCGSALKKEKWTKKAQSRF